MGNESESSLTTAIVDDHEGGWTGTVDVDAKRHGFLLPLGFAATLGVCSIQPRFRTKGEVVNVFRGYDALSADGSVRASLKYSLESSPVRDVFEIIIRGRRVGELTVHREAMSSETSHADDACPVSYIKLEGKTLGQKLANLHRVDMVFELLPTQTDSDSPSETADRTYPVILGSKLVS